MDHRDHVRLLREGVEGGGKAWADLGSGEGAFTLALADLLGPTGSIHSVDRDSRALKVQERAFRDGFPDVSLTSLVGDFTLPLGLPPLDGIVMANSLHFERDKLAVLRLVAGYLRPAGRLVVVEYDTDHGNPWVPSRCRSVPGPPSRRRPAPRHAGGSPRSRAVPRVDLLGPQPPRPGSLRVPAASRDARPSGGDAMVGPWTGRPGATAARSDQVDREYARPLDVEALARTACMSSGHFSRSFRAAFGETPYSY